MRRRQFIALIGGAVAAWPLGARGQVSRTRPLIGRLSTGSKDVPPVSKYIGRFLAGMQELGYVEGRNFDMTYAMADFHADRLPQVTAELVKLAPDVILAGGTLEAVAARKATATIPIVVTALADPVALGFAARLIDTPFVDDVTISGRSDLEPSGFSTLVERVLGEYGFCVNPQKHEYGG